MIVSHHYETNKVITFNCYYLVLNLSIQQIIVVCH
jgi:hypothetical protein